MAKNIKTNAMRFLEKAKTDFEAIFYESDGFMEGVSVAQKLNQDINQVYKTLVTKNRNNEYFVFVVPVAEELDLKKSAAATKQKNLEMIHVKDITNITGYVRGGCSPIGMKKQFRTIIDASAQEQKQIIFSGGKLGIQIKMNPLALSELINAEFSDIKK